MSNYHIPAMPKEVLEYLNVQKGSWYIDCNLGGGGHTELILEKGGKVLGIDLDPEAIAEVTTRLKKYLESRDLILVQDNFNNLDKILNSSIFNPKSSIMGVLFDLGVSTHQLEESYRGFSFNLDSPLDMRMNQVMGASAKDLVNGLYEKELSELFLKYGEENFSRPIAKKITEYRNTKTIETTRELANIVLSVKRKKTNDKIHPATKVFQALRIAVNDELNSLKEALPKAFEVLYPGGRLVVISFHSLEDRIVKNYFKSICHPEEHPSRHPEEHEDEGPKAKLLTKNLVEISEEESLQNPRARSGKLRAIEKLTTE